MIATSGIRIRIRPRATAWHRWALACVVLLVVFDRTVRADVLVLDACMKQCSEADLQAIANLRGAFQSGLGNPYLIASPDAVLHQLGGNAPLPAMQDPLLTPEKFENHLREGINKWMNAHVNVARENEEAARSLQLVLTEATENPVIAYAEPRFRTLIQRAYIGRAICLLLLKRNDEAKRAIADMVRATPEGSILDTYGTDADNVFQLSRKDLLERGVGSLTIQVDDPNVVFYFNTTGQPHKGVFAADMMLPGPYQVFMVDATNRSRRFDITVPPHGHAILNVVWQRDSEFEAPTAHRPRIALYLHLLCGSPV